MKQRIKDGPQAGEGLSPAHSSCLRAGGKGKLCGKFFAKLSFKKADKKAESVNRWSCYTLGMLILALGLTLNTKTGLGVSPIVSVAYCVSQILGMNFGDMTFVLYALFVAAQFAIRGRKSHLYDLLQFPLSLVFSRVLNLFDALIPYDSANHGFLPNFLLLILAILCTGIGVSMTVNMRLVPNPGDGIVAAVAEKMGRDQGFAKNIFDVGCVTVTCIIGLTCSGRIIGIGIGTLAAMVGVGRSIALVNHFFKERMCRAAGLIQPA